MRRSREDNERLDRLASEVKKGGGLALPLFFRTILDELLDNGSVDDDRLAVIVADVGANKTKKLAEIWHGDWDFLTADLMNQLAYQGYAVRNGDNRWSIGEKFVPGISLETIPARKGLNRADAVTVWPKEEREALSRASRAEHDLAQFVRQPRGKTHGPQIVNELRASRERYGPIMPVVTDAHGRTLDGRHRREIDPDWPVHPLDHVTTDEQAVDVILEMDYWHKKGYEKLSENAVEKIKTIRDKPVPTQNEIKRFRVEAELRRDAERSNRVVAELVGVADHLVADVREKLRDSRSLHDYVFLGGRGGGKAKHSADCWCNQGDTPPPKSKEPKEPKEPKEKPVGERIDDFLQGLVAAGYVHRKNAEGREALCARLLAETGIKRSHGALEQRLDKLIAAHRPEPVTPVKQEPVVVDKPQPDSEPVCNHSCPHCCIH